MIGGPSEPYLVDEQEKVAITGIQVRWVQRERQLVEERVLSKAVLHTFNPKGADVVKVVAVDVRVDTE